MDPPKPSLSLLSLHLLDPLPVYSRERAKTEQPTRRGGTSQVFDALDPSFAKKADPLRQLRRCLRDLHDVDGLVEEDPKSIGEARWRLPPV
jgi:hypothetical protein